MAFNPDGRSIPTFNEQDNGRKANNTTDPFDDLFDDVDPHVLIEAQRSRTEAVKSDDEDQNEDDSDSDDELSKEIMAGFEEDSNDEGDLSRTDQATTAVCAIFPLSLPQASTKDSVPSASPTESIDEGPINDGDDSDQEFEDVLLHASTTAPSNSSPSQATASTTRIASPKRAGRPRKPPRTHNFHDLPIVRREDGTEVGYKEVPPPQESYAWVSDTPIPEDDLYFAKGCIRRMVFESDPVPMNQQYKVADGALKRAKNESGIEYLTAADKAYDWNRTRRGVTGATDQTLTDGKIPRHFVLKMGPPNGPIGEAYRAAVRLKSLISHYFHSRLAISHLTLEIEIPYHTIAGQGYFGTSIDKIRDLMEDKKVHGRLTVELESTAAQRYLDCDSSTFNPKCIDHEARWQLKVQDREYVWALLRPHISRPDHYDPYSDVNDGYADDLRQAKEIFLKSSMATEAEQKDHVNEAIKKVKSFISFVQCYEAWKGDILVPRAATAPVDEQTAFAQPMPKLSMAHGSIFAGQHSVTKNLYDLQSNNAAAAPYALPLTSAPAPSSPPAPRPPNTSTPTPRFAPAPMADYRSRKARQTLLSAQVSQTHGPFGPVSPPVPPSRLPEIPTTSEGFAEWRGIAQPTLMPDIDPGTQASWYTPRPSPFRYASRADQHSTVMSFGSTLEQQACNTTPLLGQDTSEYHWRMQQEQGQHYQQ